MPIPNDWPGTDWACLILEWPNSPQWLGILRGLVTTPARGRFWDGSTGNILDTQAIGLEIEERNPVAACDAIVDALNEIADAVEGLEVNSDTQVNIQTNIVNEITSVANAVALSVAASLSASQAISSAFAWSQSLSQNFVGVEVFNNVTMQIRALEPGVTPPPAAEEATPTGITDATQDMSDEEICKRAFWIAYSGWRMAVELLEIDAWLYFTVLGTVGAIGDILGRVAQLVAGGSSLLIVPASALQQVAIVISRLQDNNVITEALEGSVDALADVDLIACIIADLVISGASTQEIQDAVFLEISVTGGLTPEQTSINLLAFNLNTLAALYYTSPLLGAAPNVLAGYDDTCQSCGE
jgi:hypothetical protein